MSLNVNNWTSTIHQEVYKILKDEIALIVNQVDTRVINFENQFLKEAAKFVRDFKSLAKETDESLDKNKVLAYENKRLLRAVLRAQLFGKFSKQNDIVKGTSANTKFAKPSILGKPPSQPFRNQLFVRQPTAFQSEQIKTSKTQFIPNVDVNNDLTELVTLHLVFDSQESIVVKNDKVIAPGMFRINTL
ncbi:hypothetical protein Tco_1019012 [Tanacetum coccineum]|uniref:Uncharacterized protein n=1 Tax=Tanacetum coccineum TaxID=301880 RepID=A0ABQ5FVZ4_9ASTR